MATIAASKTDELIARGIAYGLLARLFDADAVALGDPTVWVELRDALALAGDDRALSFLRGASAPELGREELAGRWVTWFEQGRVAPYECSNLPPAAGGHTTVLADVAGFYRAFGTAVHQERPDHVVAELELASIATLAEANARRDGDDEAAATCAAAMRSFLRDHLGRWLDAWAARVGAVEPLAPWAPGAAAAAALVAADAARRHVIPVQAMAVLPDDAGPLPDDAPLPVCGADP